MKRRPALLITIVLSSILMSGCAPEEQTPPSNMSACRDLTAEAPGDPPENTDPSSIHYNLMIEVTDKSEQAQEAILSSVSSFIECAVRDGAYLNLVLDAGEATSLITPAGFEGTESLLIEKENERGENKARTDKVNNLSRDLRTAISNIELATDGSASRLLSHAATVANSGKGAATNVFVLWSPLLGSSSDGSDCLDVDGITPSESSAQAVIDRCLDQGLLIKVPNGGATIVGAAYGAVDVEQQRFATYLQTKLLEQVFSIQTGA